MINQLRQTFKSLGDNEEDYLDIFYFLMKEVGFSYEDLKQLPIPTFLQLVKMIKKENGKNKIRPKR